MKILFKYIYLFEELIIKSAYKVFREPFIKATFNFCGKNVHIAMNSDIKGSSNISIYDGTKIGPYSVLWSTRANIIFKEKVIVGPRLVIITGDHKIDVIGKYMADVSDDEKEADNDQNVIIEKDVWIGANVTILKGVTVSEGCVIAAGSIITKSTQPYGVYAGVPAKRVKDRFSEDSLTKHKKNL